MRTTKRYRKRGSIQSRQTGGNPDIDYSYNEPSDEQLAALTLSRGELDILRKKSLKYLQINKTTKNNKYKIIPLEPINPREIPRPPLRKQSELTEKEKRRQSSNANYWEKYRVKYNPKRKLIQAKESALRYQVSKSIEFLTPIKER